MCATCEQTGDESGITLDLDDRGYVSEETEEDLHSRSSGSELLYLPAFSLFFSVQLGAPFIYGDITLLSTIIVNRRD